MNKIFEVIEYFKQNPKEGKTLIALIFISCTFITMVIYLMSDIHCTNTLDKIPNVIISPTITTKRI